MAFENEINEWKIWAFIHIKNVRVVAAAAPEDVPILAPLVISEILFRVLQGEQGALIHQSAIIGSHAHNMAFRVGYESPSQFSREYARMYRRPPMLDVQELRSSIAGSNVIG